MSVWRLPATAVMVLLCVQAAQAGIIDDFNDNSVDGLLWVAYPQPGPVSDPNWISYASGTGASVQEINQRVEITIPADATSFVFGASLHSRWKLRGDFDVQVDYELLDWPHGNGVRSALALWDEVHGFHATVERSSLGPPSDYPGWPREIYIGPMVDPVLGIVAETIVPTDDTAGKLRFARSGNVLTSYYFSQNSWHALSSAIAPTGDMDFGIASWSADYFFERQDVRVAFDNVAGTGFAGHIVPEPSTLFLATSALAMAGALVGRQRKRNTPH